MIEGFENGSGAVVEVDTSSGFIRLPAIVLIERPGGFAFVTPAYFSMVDVRSGHSIECTIAEEGGRYVFSGPDYSGWIERHDGAEFGDLTFALEKMKAEGITADGLREELRGEIL